MRVFASVTELAAAVGQTLGPGPGLLITQDRITAFADATDDHQWIHLDSERAAAGPFGATIAHGFLTLSLLPALLHDLYRVDGVRMGVNYGLNKVRFPSPVVVGSTLRATMHISEVTALADSWQVLLTVTISANGGPKPTAIVEALSRVYV